MDHVMVDRVYVIGHVNPDTDSIAAAMGYAWLLRERDAMDTVAARAGATNPQTTWILEAPRIGTTISAYRCFTTLRSCVSHRFDTITAESPLRDAWVIASRTAGIAPVVSEDGTPIGLITGYQLIPILKQAGWTTPGTERNADNRSPEPKLPGGM